MRQEYGVILEGGTNTRTFDYYFLADLQGNFATEKIIKSEYGYAWMIKRDGQRPTFVSLAKRASTYAQKGYQLMKVTYTYETYPVPSANRESIKREAIVTGVEVSKADPKDQRNRNDLPNELWLALKRIEDGNPHLQVSFEKE
jgi:hypothetical protein